MPLAAAPHRFDKRCYPVETGIRRTCSCGIAARAWHPGGFWTVSFLWIRTAMEQRDPRPLGPDAPERKAAVAAPPYSHAVPRLGRGGSGAGASRREKKIRALRGGREQRRGSDDDPGGEVRDLRFEGRGLSSHVSSREVCG